MPVTPAPDILGRVWRDLGLDPAALTRLRADGDAPVYPAHHDVAGLAQATIAGVALAASEVWRAATSAALAGRAAGKVKSAAAEAGAIAAMIRPKKAWRESAQGQAVADLSLISLARIGAAPKTQVRGRAAARRA